MKKIIIAFGILFAVCYSNFSIAQLKDDCILCCDLADKDIDIRERCNNSDCSTWSCKNNVCIPTNPNTYTIMLTKPVFRVFQFDAKFKENCQYNEPGTYWHKLMKISTIPNLDDHSIRLGWRSNNSSFIEVGLYGHINSEMHFLSLDYVALL